MGKSNNHPFQYSTHLFYFIICLATGSSTHQDIIQIHLRERPSPNLYKKSIKMFVYQISLHRLGYLFRSAVACFGGRRPPWMLLCPALFFASAYEGRRFITDVFMRVMFLNYNKDTSAHFQPNILQEFRV